MDGLQEAFGKMIPEFQNIFGTMLEQIILYGSRARGTQTDESDVDIAVIVRHYTEDMHDEMIEFTVDLELEYNKVFSIMLIDSEHFREWGRVLPFYKNVKKDGIMLWSAAQQICRNIVMIAVVKLWKMRKLCIPSMGNILG